MLTRSQHVCCNTVEFPPHRISKFYFITSIQILLHPRDYFEFSNMIHYFTAVQQQSSSSSSRLCYHQRFQFPCLRYSHFYVSLMHWIFNFHRVAKTVYVVKRASQLSLRTFSRLICLPSNGTVYRVCVCVDVSLLRAASSLPGVSRVFVFIRPTRRLVHSWCHLFSLGARRIAHFFFYFLFSL